MSWVTGVQFPADVELLMQYLLLTISSLDRFDGRYLPTQTPTRWVSGALCPG